VYASNSLCKDSPSSLHPKLLRLLLLRLILLLLLLLLWSFVLLLPFRLPPSLELCTSSSYSSSSFSGA